MPESTDHTRSSDGPTGNRSRFFTPTVREAIAEFFGTFVLMVFGMGSVAQLVLSQGLIGSADQVRWSWGFGVTFGVYVSGGISGGHLNPAVTFALCAFKKTPWSKLIPYITAQYLGSFVASCVVFIVYYDAIALYKGSDPSLATAGIFSTYPQGYLSTWNGLADQTFGTALLMFLIMALTDPKNMAPHKGYLPLAVGLVVTAIGMTFSLNCGYAINPARDLAPRLFTFVAGWGTKVFSVNGYQWFWIPVVGPHIGALLGAGIYIQFLGSWDSCLPRCCQRQSTENSYELENVKNDGLGRTEKELNQESGIDNAAANIA